MAEGYPSWTSKCGRETRRVIEVILPDGSKVWDIEKIGEISNRDLYFPTKDEAVGAFNIVIPILEGKHQNVDRCCPNPNYEIDADELTEEKLSYVTPCGRHSLKVLRKTTKSGRHVWDVTNGREDHVVAEMYDTEAEAAAAWASGVDFLKTAHDECCIISDSQ